MPNLNQAIGEEIRRLARKEAKAAVAPGQKSLREARKQIAALRKQVRDQQRELKALNRALQRAAPKPQTEAPSGPRPRYSADWVAKHRAKLGVSAADYGRLVGVSPLTVYNWEKGKSTPREEPLRRWAEVRKLGKREALRHLAALDGV